MGEDNQKHGGFFEKSSEIRKCRNETDLFRLFIIFQFGNNITVVKENHLRLEMDIQPDFLRVM